MGYRDEVQRIARKLGITGYVENLKPYDVRIVAEGEEEKLREFLEMIKIRRYPIFVEDIEVEWGPATGEFSYFEIRRGEWQEELFERLDVAARLLYRSVELGEKSVELSARSVELGEKSVELSARSVELGEKILEAIRDEGKKTREEIRLLRLDLRKYMEARFGEIEKRLSRIEEALRRASLL